MTPYRKFILIFMAIFLVVIGLVLFKNYLDSTYVVKVMYEESQRVELVETPEYGGEKVIGEIKKSGDEVRVGRATSHIIRYTGTEGFADGIVPIDSSKTEVNIKPDYSEKRYAKLQEEAKASVTSQIVGKYPETPQLYSIEPGLMFDRAKWYVVLLKFKGTYNQNADNLAVLFKKEGSEWKMVSKPRVYMTTYNTPGVPVEVLTRVAGVNNDIVDSQIND